MEFNAIELEILWKRLISVVDEAAAAFVRTCFSTLVRDGNDFAIVLTDAGRSLAQSNMSLPGFIGCLQRRCATSSRSSRGDVREATSSSPTIRGRVGAHPRRHHRHADLLTGACGVRGGVLIFPTSGRLRSNSSREIYERACRFRSRSCSTRASQRVSSK